MRKAMKMKAAEVVDRMVQATVRLAEETGATDGPTAEYSERYAEVVAPYLAELEEMGVSVRDASGWRIEYLLGTPKWMAC